MGKFFRPAYLALYSANLFRGEIITIDSFPGDSVSFTLMVKNKTFGAPGYGPLACDVYSISRGMDCVSSCTTFTTNTSFYQDKNDNNHPANGWPGQFVNSGKKLPNEDVRQYFAPVFLQKNSIWVNLSNS
ncbi:MAG: hypothetical protein R3B47_05260 [Bacteroidia bacterium]